VLTDPYARQFSYLRLSLTDACNLKCQYCLPDGYKKKQAHNFLDVNEIQHVVSGFAELGISKVRLTGGEPALRKDLPQIITAVASIPGITSVALTTNGLNLHKHINRWHSAGLTHLNVSVDSLNPAQFKLITGSNQFIQIMDGIEQAIALGLTVKMNAVLMKGLNLHEWEQFMAFIQTKPITLRFIEVMQTLDNHAFFAAQHVRGSEMYEQLIQAGWQPVLGNISDGPAKTLWHPDFQGRIGFIMPYSKDFCTTCNRLRVSARGALHTCLFAEAGSDLRYLLQSPQQQTALKQKIVALVQQKTPSHPLHEGGSGATSDLAMLGG
jgi:cyclic pyranopterin phosphate synthase